MKEVQPLKGTSGPPSIGRYSIERELGQGGMATVYLAQDIKHRRRVALNLAAQPGSMRVWFPRY